MSDLPEELVLMRQSLRRFVDEELVPLETGAAIDDEAVMALRGKAQSLGFWAPDAPVELGGQGLDPLGMTVFWEEISRSPALSARDMRVFGALTGPILLGLRGGLQERFLLPVLRGAKSACFAQTEPDAGSDPGAIRTRAVRIGDDYVINGVKRFITDADRADFVQLIASTNPDAGSRGLSCFLIDMNTPGLTVTARYPTVTGDAPCEVVLRDVRVPVTQRVGEEGQGFDLAQSWITEGRIFRHGARACGVAERCLEMASRYARARHTFGQPLSERQSVQFMIAETYAELQFLRALVRDAARALSDGSDARLLSWIVKCHGAEIGFRAADRCMQIHGGLGLTTDLPIERMWREQRSFIITEGAAEVMRAAIAKRVINAYA